MSKGATKSLPLPVCLPQLFSGFRLRK
jgi:hypothetical protein